MYAAAASFVALFVFLSYVGLRGPTEHEGLEARFADGTTELRFVESGSSAERHGLRAGDIILAIDGQLLRNPQDWTAVMANMVVGRPQRWEVLRGGERLALDLVPEPRGWGTRTLITLQYNVVAGCYLAVGLFIALRRPFDPVARIGAWFIGAASMVHQPLAKLPREVR